MRINQLNLIMIMIIKVSENMGFFTVKVCLNQKTLLIKDYLEREKKVEKVYKKIKTVLNIKGIFLMISIMVMES